MMEPLHIFVSHSSQDKAIADSFVHSLREAGADVWYDEHNLGAGHLKNEIQRELGRRPIFIVLLSPVALACSWLMDECKCAYDLQCQDPRRVILPITVTPLQETDLTATPYLHDLKRMNVGDRWPSPTMADAASQALRLLGLTPTGQLIRLSAPHPSETAADLVLRGQGLNMQEQFAATVSLFERATQLDPENWNAWVNLGYTQHSMGHSREALAAYEQALTLKPTDSATWDRTAYILINLDRYEEGLNAAERATTLQPDSVGALTNKSWALISLGRNQEGLVTAEQAITLRPDYAGAWVNKSWALNNLGHTQEGLAAAERAIMLQPDNASAWVNKASALTTLGRYADGLVAVEQAVALHPDDAAAWSNQASVLISLGRAAVQHSSVEWTSSVSEHRKELHHVTLSL